MQRVLRIPVLHDAIRRTRYTQSQSKLGALERRTNTEGAFGGGSQAARLRGCTILLVDDVFTTGSTLRSVATCALELGARRTDAATLVATRL
jgi:predicted amidophosphoribosyltransferase